jgi:hypothetical protein
MGPAWLAVRRRLHAIQQEYRLILQELRHTPPTDYQRRAQLTAWACICVAEYLTVLRQWPGRAPPPVDTLEDADRDDADEITPSA